MKTDVIEQTEPDKHYLQIELEALVQSSVAAWNFLQQGSLDGIWYWDLEKPEQEYMSPEMWRLLGIDPATKKHDPAEWQDLIFEEDLAVALRNFEAHCADPDHPYDQIVRYRHADGSTVWVRCRGIAVRDHAGNAIRMLGAHNDITSVKIAEQAAQDNSAKFAAANAELRSFAYSVSHDLKAPANTAGMVLEELKDHLQEQGDQEGLELITLGMRAVNRMHTLVDDVLGYTSLLGQKTEFTEVDLNALMEDVVGILAADIKQSSAHIVIDQLPVVRANSPQLILLFQNLIANAIKFQSEGSTPEISVGTVRTGRRGRIAITVSDNGIGIEPRYQERIFTMFERLHQREEFSGTGLGLSLCRRIALNHDGDISIRSAVGEGSTFTVELPENLK